jgi:hypothetical protein
VCYITKEAKVNKKLESIERKIAQIKEELMGIGEMRPGSLTYQYQRPKEKRGGFYQISYTYKMKSKTELKNLKNRLQNTKDLRDLLVVG